MNYYFLTFAFFLCSEGSDLRSSAPIVTKFVSDEEGLATGCIRDNEPMVLPVPLLDEMCCVDIDRFGNPSDGSSSIGGGCKRKFLGNVLFKRSSSI